MSDTSMSIKDAVETYLDHRRTDLQENTLQSHRYRLKHLIRWASEKGVESTQELDGKLLIQYKAWRQQDGDLNNVTLHTQMSTIRVWVKFLEKMEVVDQGLTQRIDVPDLGKNEDVRTVSLPSDHAQKIDAYLERYDYASRDHALWTILYGIGVRIGAAHGLDLRDFDRDERRLRFRHRPEEDTPLKNGESGQRATTLSEETTDVLCDYIDDVRIKTDDKYGRKPILTGTQGRPSKSTLRRAVYRLTQPCQIGLECPHGTTKEACSIAGYTDNPNGCPSIVNPHGIRKLVITDYRREEIPDKYISDRCDVSQRIMDKHYEVRTEEEKQEQRRDYFE
jgi:site-specific recombinase XerC